MRPVPDGYRMCCTISRRGTPTDRIRVKRATRQPSARRVLADQRVYAAYETYEDLDYILKYAGEDNLVIATDYGHTGQTAVTDALVQLTERAKRGEVDPAVVDKISRTNPAALFGLEDKRASS